ncbi:probable multidrug resistance-associated protein lethal(2)03659 [Uranotaenia lowii]|uniref:probable multidrug resistance-associated protein lethal(2)03659 n=1 Tax=Uranotaenia lowii TaxID=190385 RepID=UPI002478B16A|nr:probable multidrug resistance-associated protein lethal(2)03659 [Uranotaenia lowii]
MYSTRTNTARPEHPYAKANIFGKYFFWWLWELLRTGLRRQIVVDDIYRPLDGHRSHQIGTRFEEEWLRQIQVHPTRKTTPASENCQPKSNDADEEHDGKPWQMLRVVLKIYGRSVLLFGTIYSLLESGCRIVQPFLLGQLILYFDRLATDRNDHNGSSDHQQQGRNRQMDLNGDADGDDGGDIDESARAFLYAGGIVLTVVLPLAIFHVYQLFLLQIGMKIRIGCCALVYRKILQLRSCQSADGLSGRVINLMSNDVSRFDYAVIFFHDLWKGPVELIIVTGLVYDLMGPSGLIGIVLLLLFIPGQAWLGKASAGFRMKASQASEERIQFSNEVIQGIQVIKMYVWERPIELMVQMLRVKEIRALRGSAFIRSALFALRILPKLSIFLSLVVYVLLGNALTAVRVYMLVSFFSVINHSMVEFWPLAVTSCAEAWISLKRIQSFLMQIESKDSVEEESEAKLVQVTMDGVKASWPESNFNLNIHCCNIQVGELWSIIGPIGSGKSSVLNLIVKELESSEGSVVVSGKVSYCSQRPWLFEGTVRENIIFTEDFDEMRYNEVIRVCALERDFKLWPNGDTTIVGERGVSLSGGQKARINLARAVYRKANIYLLDDPLSAVDAHVGKHIMEECVRRFLSSHICILVTHQVQHLKDTDRILLLNAGQVEASGLYRELGESIPMEPALQNPNATEKYESEDIQTDNVVQHTNEEGQKQGNVGFTGYFNFLKSVRSWIFVGLVAVLLMAWQAASTATDYIVFIWVNWEQNHSDSPESTWTTELHIVVYASLITLTLLLSINSFAFFEMCLRASRNLHLALYRGIASATMYFFNTNSSGRIMNRFSKDIGLIDSSLPVVLIDSLYFFLELVGIIVIVSLANYWLLVPTAIMGVIFYLLRHIFLETARNVKRAEAITRSPVFSHTNETIEGLVTVRAFNAQAPMLEAFDARQDLNTSAAFLFGAITRGFAFWLDLICSLYIASVIFSFLVMGKEILSGNVGLAITQVLNLIGMCNWGLRQTAELENQMTSVERVLEYSQLDPELDVTKFDNTDSLDEWPKQGGIGFRDVTMRYGLGSEPVLKGVSFEILPKERIGIVGRTGAGKSSIIQALFRLAPIDGSSQVSGFPSAIEIDKIDIGGVPLRKLRAAIAIIPQDPVIFSGSLRNNLDPAGQLGDDRIWKALDQVELKQTIIRNCAGGLETKLAAGGANFSVGQRQLICLARAILRDSRIVVMDEATASMDQDTDRLIQRTIREHFRNCTILTIAHRMHTVMDSDRILVMDAGRVVEFDSPRNLLQASGYFRRLFNESSLDESQYL